MLLPTNQWISPLGTRILDNQERLVSSTISPDGTYMAALGWNNFSGFLTIINLKTHAIVQQHLAGYTVAASSHGLLGRAPTARCTRPTARRYGSRSRPT